LAAIHAVRHDPDFEPLAAVFKRAANILKQAAAKKEVVPQDGPQRSALQEPAEIELFDCLEHVSGDVEHHLVEARFEEGLKVIVTLKPKLDAFFEKVMVMVEDGDLRAQRLALLSRLVRLITRIADISEIQGPEKRVQ
jgi:glycyl-tRNA synthetase beta chain